MDVRTSTEVFMSILDRDGVLWLFAPHKKIWARVFRPLEESLKFHWKLLNYDKVRMLSDGRKRLTR